MHVNRGSLDRRLAVLAVVAHRRWRTGAIAALAAALAIASQGASSLAEGSQGVASSRVEAAVGSPDESRSLHPRAAALVRQYRGNLPAMAAVGSAALHAARNEATIAAMLRLRWVGRLDAGLEHYGAGLTASDVASASLAVAGVQHYSELIHKALMHRAPNQIITVSVQDQRLLAYDRGRVVVDTPVTTGRPSLPTDIGAMQVLEKDAPWTMHSPWPKDSPNWYPDTPVQMVMWFTKNGEGLHDASWQPAGTYGPGSTTGPFASHGCIHVPVAAETVLFNWAPLGTPVVVYPGDGSAMAAQMAQVSVDAMGNPITGFRGA